MSNKIEKPCVYHYLFSRLPDYRTDEEVSLLAKQLSSPIIESFQLATDEIFDSPHPDVKAMMYKGNEQSEIYSLQFWFNDILTTILTLNQTNQSQDPLLYFQDVLNPQFPNPENHVRFGEMTVLFAQAKATIAVVQEISAACFETKVGDKLPQCRFEWGSLYFLPKVNRYVLLIPNTKNLPKGDIFLAFDFPMLESIRQKLIYEDGESLKLKVQNFKIESELKHLLELITENLDGRDDNLSKVEGMLDRMDEAQAELYENISKTESVLQTLAINIRNFKTYLEPIPINYDTLFKSLSKKFQFTYEDIEAGLKYTKLLLPSIIKRQEIIPLKIDVLRQRAQEQNIRIEKRQNMLIAVLGVMIGTGQVLPVDMPWKFKLLWMGLSGLAAYLLVLLLQLRLFKRKRKKVNKD